MAGTGFTSGADDLRAASADIAHALGGSAGLSPSVSGPSDYGHDALHATVDGLCTAATNAVRTFQRDAVAASTALDVAARIYTDSDGDAEFTLNRSTGAQ